MTARLSASARREQLLVVARGVFAEKGFHATSMNDIADAAGVTKPVLYQHFESKRELYLALLDECGNRLIEALSKATSEATDGKSQTERGFQAYFRFVHDDIESFKILFGSGVRRDEEFAHAVNKVVASAAEAIAPLIAAPIDADHQRTIAHALTGIAEGVSRQLMSSGRSFDPDVVARRVADLAWAGLRALH